MANDLSERKAAARRRQRTLNNRVNDQAVLGSSDNILADPNLPGNVLIQVQSSNGLLDNRSVRAPTKSFPLTPGTPVKLKRDYMDRLQIDEIDNEMLLAQGVDPVGQAIAQHSPSAPQASFETFRCIPDAIPSTFVNVKAANFISNGITYQFGGASIDLGAGGANVIPSAGNMARIIVALMGDFVTLEAVSSTPRSSGSVPLGDADTQEAYNNLSVGSIASWYLDLADAQSTVTVTDITPDGDLRNTINLPGGNAASRVALTAQTATIAPTAIVTPPTAGEYTVSVILTDTTASVSGGTVLATILYNDENGARTQVTSTVLLSAQGYTSSVFTFHALTTAAIQYSTTVSGVVVGSPQYSLYINVTRIG